MAGKLTLIPTPIDEQSPLEPVALDLLKKAIGKKSQFIVEDPKPGRRRWVRFGLPREEIENFVSYNEHSWEEELPGLIDKLQKGVNLYLMSDGGMPAFCDPGRALVDNAHSLGIEVSCTPFSNSVIQALALSGFDHNRFVFEGFPPAKSPEREDFLKRLSKERRTVVLMDTPYRLNRLLDDLKKLSWERRSFFLACDLNSTEQLLVRGSLKDLSTSVGKSKREFVLVVSSF